MQGLSSPPAPRGCKIGHSCGEGTAIRYLPGGVPRTGWAYQGHPGIMGCPWPGRGESSGKGRRRMKRGQRDGRCRSGAGRKRNPEIVTVGSGQELFFQDSQINRCFSPSLLCVLANAKAASAPGSLCTSGNDNALSPPCGLLSLQHDVCGTRTRAARGTCTQTQHVEVTVLLCPSKAQEAGFFPKRGKAPLQTAPTASSQGSPHLVALTGHTKL